MKADPLALQSLAVHAIESRKESTPMPDPLSTSPAQLATDASNDYRVAPYPPCTACGAIHGGVTSEVLCLRHHLRASRLECGRLRNLLERA